MPPTTIAPGEAPGTSTAAPASRTRGVGTRTTTHSPPSERWKSRWRSIGWDFHLRCRGRNRPLVSLSMPPTPISTSSSPSRCGSTGPPPLTFAGPTPGPSRVWADCPHAPPRSPERFVRILDSRRLTGPSLLLDVPGAILDVALHGLDAARAIEAWRAEMLPLLDAVGWKNAPIGARAHAQGVSLAFGAPFDALFSATEVNEAAWHAAAAQLGGGDTTRGDADPRRPERDSIEEDGDAPP